MRFIQRVMLCQTLVPHQEDNIQPKGKTGKRKPIRLRAAVGAPRSNALRIRTSVARVNRLDHPI
jgi:hypothetical protein